MINKKLLILITIVSASCNASPNDVGDFSRLSSSLSKEKSSSEMKMSNEKLASIVQSFPQESGSPFLSHFIHSGNNLFFKPNIVLGTKIENPFVSREALERNKTEIKTKNKKIKKHESKEKLSTTTTTTTTIAPTTTTLTNVGITEKIGKFSENKEKEEVKIPEPPYLLPPKLSKPIILKESEPVEEPTIIPQPPTFVNLNLPPVDIFPENVEILRPYVPLHFRDPYVIQDPCATPRPTPQYQGIHERISAEKSIDPPKLPNPTPMQLPVSVVPCTPEIVGTRFMPYVDVSKMSMEYMTRKSLQIPNWHLSQVLAERIPMQKEKDATINIPSLAAFCAHNIALERALPNIVRNNEKFDDPYIPHWIYP